MNLGLSSLRLGGFSLFQRIPSITRAGIRWNSSTTPESEPEPETKSRRKPSRPPTRAASAHRELITLRPSEIFNSGQTVYDLSNFTNARFNTYIPPDPATLLDPTIPNTRRRRIGLISQITYHQIQSQGGRRPFPPGTKGVLYYHHEPNRPAISGELRFRICDDPRPSSFAAGHDLLLPDNYHVWKVPIFAYTKGTYYKGVRYLLVTEGLLDAQIFADLEKQRGANLPKNPDHKSRILYDITDPFELDLSSRQCKITVIKQTTTHRFILIPYSYRRYRPDVTYRCPFVGRIRVQLTPSPTSTPTREVYNLRILAILSPEGIQPGDIDDDERILPPKAGELVTWKSKSGECFPWEWVPEENTA